MTSTTQNQTRNPIRNIRIATDIWKKAKRDALDRDMTLQEWLTTLIIAYDSQRRELIGLGETDASRIRGTGR